MQQHVLIKKPVHDYAGSSLRIRDGLEGRELLKGCKHVDRQAQLTACRVWVTPDF